jgi:four helix bundle protein
MNEQEFKDRTKKFALRVISLVEALPRKQTAQVTGKQLLRSGTSVGANYRAACTCKIYSRYYPQAQHCRGTGGRIAILDGTADPKLS